MTPGDRFNYSFLSLLRLSHALNFGLIKLAAFHKKIILTKDIKCSLTNISLNFKILGILNNPIYLFTIYLFLHIIFVFTRYFLKSFSFRKEGYLRGHFSHVTFILKTKIIN